MNLQTTNATAADGVEAEARDLRWLCPICGSDNLTVYYDERRASAVGTDPDGTEPWPSNERDEFVDIDPDRFAFACDSCLASDITPVREDAREAGTCL
jgi:hypothetical protein